MSKYHVGQKIGALTLLSLSVMGNYRWRVRCECGFEFYRETGKLQKFAHICAKCKNAERVARTLANHSARLRARGYKTRPEGSKAPCYACFDLPHRVEGAICIGCGQPFQEQPETRAEVRWQSSAGYALGFAHG